MKMNVLLVVPMVNLIVVPIVVLMVNVSMVHGHVTALLTVMTVQMKLAVTVTAVNSIGLRTVLRIVTLHGLTLA
jgi:hypothetical protein